MMAEYLAELVDELMSLNDDNLAQRVIDNSDVQWCLSELHDILAADVAPVVHSRWETNSDRPDTLICSMCKCGFDMWKHDPHNYCPNCGAKMDGGAENG